MSNASRPADLPSISTDLHTHLTGAPRAGALIRLALQHDLSYPAAMAQLAGIALPAGIRLTDAHTMVLPGGIAAPAIGSPTIRLRDLLPGSRARLAAAMDMRDGIAGDGPAGAFAALERAYAIRRPLAAHPLLLRDILWSVATDARRDGITHIEFSASAPLQDPPDGGRGWLAIASRTAAAIHGRMGLRILLLATVNRHTPPASLLRSLALLDEAMAAYPCVVGLDVAGHETNPTADFLPLILSWAATRLRRGLPAVLRVHAGETPCHPTNVRDVLEGFRAIGLPPGMGRIGHALYGVGRREVALARDTGAVIEMGLASNRTLGYRPGPDRIGGGARLARLIGAGVATVLATDGSGIYRTDPVREVRQALSDGAPPSILATVIRHEEDHKGRMQSAFPLAFDKEGGAQD